MSARGGALGLRRAPRGRSTYRRARLFAPLVAPLVAALVAITPGSPAFATENDGIYGRFDGDLDLRLGAGAAFADGGPALVARADALYLSTAGIYAHYTDALGSGGPTVARSIAAGLTLAPLFLGRLAKARETGPARLDLLIDSFSLSLGAFWHVPRGGSITRDPGLEVALSIAFPLLPDATGLYVGVRGALRFRAGDLAPDSAGTDILERGALLSITLAWHHIVPAHLVDPGDRIVR